MNITIPRVDRELLSAQKGLILSIMELLKKAKKKKEIKVLMGLVSLLETIIDASEEDNKEDNKEDTVVICYYCKGACSSTEEEKEKGDTGCDAFNTSRTKEKKK